VPQIRRTEVPGWIDPADAFEALYAGAENTIWLDAGAGATEGFSYLAAASVRSRLLTASVSSGTVTVSRPLDPDDVAVETPGSLLDWLRADLAEQEPAEVPVPAAAAPDPASTDAVADTGGFQLGWVGWLGYELTGPTDVAAGPSAPSRPPDAELLLVDRAIAFNHAARTVTLICRALPHTTAESAVETELAAWAQQTTEALQAARQHPAPEPSPHTDAATPVDVHWRHSSTAYARLIEQCQARINAGDAYQLCLTNEVTVSGRFDPLEVYRRLRATSPSHHGGLLIFGDRALLSASPEQFLAVSTDGLVRTRPIKGTRPRSLDPATDDRLRAELLASDKERAENLMIVDLMRNDLGRVAMLGTVAVTALLAVESYPHVHQLVSTVEARLAPGLTGLDALEACFPAGSMTGAPKRSAMGILRGLEGGERGVYAGAFGYLGLDGTMDLAMVIRSIVLGPAGASIGTGGGITALSNADEEIEETQVKARALIHALIPGGHEAYAGV
jgi:anthranilate/para-aminobenzoate synthase component I